MTDAPNLGKIITGEAQRDAIHVAIAPMVATERVHPGQRVNANGGASQPHVGIVDPFLDRAAMAGDRFWLFLFPNTVTSLRHQWTHPAFDNERTEAERWLRAYAAKLNSYDEPDEAFRSLIEGLKAQEIYCHGSITRNRIEDLDDPDELKKQAEIYLGKKLDFGSTSVRCGC